ncbi:MAG: alkaline phosphatase [Pseudomonadales bacterium]|nr:alkaline phosphatase [Pseudomonadales bacterium]
MLNNKTLSALSLAVALSACSDSDNDNNDPNAVVDTIAALEIQCVETVLANADADADDVKGLSFELVGSYVADAEFDSSAAEIVSYDSCSDKLYVVNSQSSAVDVLDFTGTAVNKTSSLTSNGAAAKSGKNLGAANSVVAKQGVVAVVFENDNKQENGVIALYRSDTLALIETFEAGALPDMVSMTDNARYILAANEGEPNGEYTIDPEGSVTIVDLSSGLTVDTADITQVSFAELNNQAAQLKDDGVRLPSPKGASVAEDLEPEYIAITADNKAVVAMQENNAFMTIDIASGEIESVKGLGTKRWDGEAKLDFTNEDGNYSPQSVPQLVGLYMPDAISAFEIGGQSYIISANEGDGREYIYETTQSVCDAAGQSWDGDEFQPGGDDEDAVKYQNEVDDCISYTDEARGADLENVASDHPLSASSGGAFDISDEDNSVGRIKVVYADTDTAIAASDDILTFGARSFSIWNLETELVYDSGDELARRANTSSYWNMTNDNNLSDESNDNRSDDKGVEPEATEIAVINGETIAFIGLERHGGIAAYNVSNPAQPVYLNYINNRNFDVDVCTTVDDGDCDDDSYNPAAGDLGPESIEYFSKLGKHFIAVGNEVSGTTSVFELKLN